jgi:hypothetical protein
MKKIFLFAVKAPLYFVTGNIALLFYAVKYVFTGKKPAGKAAVILGLGGAAALAFFNLPCFLALLALYELFLLIVTIRVLSGRNAKTEESGEKSQDTHGGSQGDREKTQGFGDDPQGAHEKAQGSRNTGPDRAFGQFTAFFGGMTKEQAKHEFRRLMKEYHPDNPDGNAEMTRKISEEYNRIYGSGKRERTYGEDD